MKEDSEKLSLPDGGERGGVGVGFMVNGRQDAAPCKEPGYAGIPSAPRRQDKETFGKQAQRNQFRLVDQWMGGRALLKAVFAPTPVLCGDYERRNRSNGL